MKKVKSIKNIGLLFGVVALMLSVMTSVLADAASSGFSTETIEGTWILHAQGTVALAVPGFGGEPFASTGRFTFNKVGTCERELETVTTLGPLGPLPPLISCTVIVNPDGTGSVTSTSLSPFSPLVINFQIVDEDRLVGLGTVGIMADPLVGVIHFERQVQPGSGNDD